MAIKWLTRYLWPQEKIQRRNYSSGLRGAAFSPFLSPASSAIWSCPHCKPAGQSPQAILVSTQNFLIRRCPCASWTEFSPLEGQEEGKRHQFVVEAPKERCMERSTSLEQDVRHTANTPAEWQCYIPQPSWLIQSVSRNIGASSPGGGRDPKLQSAEPPSLLGQLNAQKHQERGKKKMLHSSTVLWPRCFIQRGQI